MRFVCALNAETALSGRTRTKNSLVASPFASDPLKKYLFFSTPLSSDLQFHLPILSLPILKSIFRSSLQSFPSIILNSLFRSSKKEPLCSSLLFLSMSRNRVFPFYFTKFFCPLTLLPFPSDRGSDPCATDRAALGGRKRKWLKRESFGKNYSDRRKHSSVSDEASLSVFSFLWLKKKK